MLDLFREAAVKTEQANVSTARAAVGSRCGQGGWGIEQGKTETTELGYEGQGGWPGSPGREKNAAQTTEVGEGLARRGEARWCADLGRQERIGDTLRAPKRVVRGAASRPATASFHLYFVLGREGEVEGTLQAQPFPPTCPPAPHSNHLDLRPDQIHTGHFLGLRWSSASQLPLPLRLRACCHFPREISQPLIRLSVSLCSQTDRSCSINVY